MELKAGMWIRMNRRANGRYTLTKENSYGVIEMTHQGRSMVKFATLTGNVKSMFNDNYEYSYEIENMYFDIVVNAPSTDIFIKYMLRWGTMNVTELAKIGNYLGNYQGGRK